MIILIVVLLIGLILYIYYKNKPHNQAYSIGIIGGADGPTSLYIGTSAEKEIQEGKWNQLLQTCKEITEPKVNKITGEEIKNYLIHEYDAKEIVLLPRNKGSLKYNVIINHYPEALEELKVSEDNKEMDHFEQFRNIELISDEQYNLSFAALIIPRTSKTEIYYQDNAQVISEYIKQTKSLFTRIIKRLTGKILEGMEEIEVKIELSTGHIQLNNGGRSLMDEIVLWKGIVQEDIDKCTTSFIAYAAAMRDRGKITYNEKEGKWVEKTFES